MVQFSGDQHVSVSCRKCCRVYNCGLTVTPEINPLLGVRIKVAWNPQPCPGCGTMNQPPAVSSNRFDIVADAVRLAKNMTDEERAEAAALVADIEADPAAVDEVLKRASSDQVRRFLEKAKPTSPADVVAYVTAIAMLLGTLLRLWATLHGTTADHPEPERINIIVNEVIRQTPESVKGLQAPP